MNRIIIMFDSLKFYKLKNENTARILFVLVYLLFLGASVFPVGEALGTDVIDAMLNGDAQKALPLLKWTNGLYFLFQFILYLVTSFIALIYASCHVMESEGFPSKKAVISALRGLPRLIGFLLLMIVPAVLSSLFAFIPLIFLMYALFFVPLLIVEGKRGIFESIAESFRSTKGIKFNIFITQMMIYFLMNLPISLFSTAFLYTGNSNTLSEHLVLSFLRAAYVLMGGRLLGNFYILVIKNQEKSHHVNADLNDENTDETDQSEDDEENSDQDDKGNDTEQ